ncbi:Uncharacterised protein [Serratia quinivorans]|nr:MULTISPECIES: hypothetical protein [Serratia]CAI0836286.1 Uncharacterised protein [Serratia quinivorans]CAI1032704.1 Uncharacterised protein [Serratia quinivorans]CAI1034676.1 Uncharacterised protein [Serratia quinivorans]CAI1050041.1 Uncharacterised protein [Serratia quinivorans]CAI1125195.1 Uncharacterised protein [Serratia entomophila]
MNADKKRQYPMASRSPLYDYPSRRGFLLAIVFSLLFWLLFIAGIVLLG